MYILINPIKSMRKIENQNIRKLYKHATSYAITLPIALIRELDWQKKQKVVVEKKGNTLIIKDWEK